MVHYSKVINGVLAYADNEIIGKLNGSIKAWGIGIAMGILGKRAEQIFAELRQNPMLVSLGLVNGEMIDIEAVYAEALKMAQKGSATVNIPMLGAITFGQSDVESLYRYIIGG